MDGSDGPAFANLLISLENLIWYLKDSFSVLRNIGSTPPWVQSLWAEIDALRLLAERAVGHGLDFNCLGGSDANDALQLISLADSAVRDLEENVRQLLGDSVRPVDNLPVDQQICESYQRLLQSYRLSLVDSMNRLQLYNMRRMMSSLQDPAVLSYLHHDSEVMSGHAELVFLRDSTAISDVNLCIPKNQMTVPQSSRRGREEQMATTLGLPRQVRQIRCSASCRCICHSVMVKFLPKLMRKTITRLFPTISGEPGLVHHCSQLDCRLRNAGRTRITVLHSAFLKFATEASVLLRDFNFKIHPRVHPVVSESSDIVRFARIGNAGALKNLIFSERATIFDATDDNWTLLHNAAFQGHLDTVRFLLVSGADTDVTDIKSRKASHFAKFRALRRGATDQEKEIARLFPDQDFRYDFELSPIHSAILREYDSFDEERPSLNTLLDLGKELSKGSCNEDWSCWKLSYQNASPLFQEMISHFKIAAHSRNALQDPFRDLLEQPDAVQRWTPLQWAAFVDRKDEFVSLLEAGADPFKTTPSGRNFLHHAAESGTSDILEYLLNNRYHEKGLDINLHDIWGETPLHLAAEKSSLSVALLLRHGAAPNVVQGEQQVPLHHVYLNKGADRAKAIDLLSSHIDCPINAQDEMGRTPLMYFLDSIPCIELLLSHGANKFICDNSSRSIMHHACIQDQPQIIAMLLNKYPESAQELAMHTDAEGNTPLFISLRYHHAQCAAVLLSQAPISIAEDRHGKSLLQYAVEMGDERVLRLARSIPRVGMYETPAGGEYRNGLGLVVEADHGEDGRKGRRNFVWQLSAALITRLRYALGGVLYLFAHIGWRLIEFAQMLFYA